jgi:hypothetical protein
MVTFKYDSCHKGLTSAKTKAAVEEFVKCHHLRFRRYITTLHQSSPLQNVPEGAFQIFFKISWANKSYTRFDRRTLRQDHTVNNLLL